MAKGKLALIIGRSDSEDEGFVRRRSDEKSTGDSEAEAYRKMGELMAEAVTICLRIKGVKVKDDNGDESESNE